MPNSSKTNMESINQPTPAQQEWTRESVLAIARQHVGADAISDAVAAAHNASLAAERGITSRLESDLIFERKEKERTVNKLVQQLADERERYRKLLDAERRRCFDLEQQLAAERENRKAIVGKLSAEYIAVFNKQRDEIHQLREQLVAERESLGKAGEILIERDEQLRMQLAHEHENWKRRYEHTVRAEEKIQQLCEQNEIYRNALLSADEENKQLKKQLAVAVEALEFYADLKEDGGHRASAALAKIGEKK